MYEAIMIQYINGVSKFFPLPMHQVMKTHDYRFHAAKELDYLKILKFVLKNYLLVRPTFLVYLAINFTESFTHEVFEK